MQDVLGIQRPNPSSRHLVIDCSKSPETALTSVLCWVSALPERRDVHVILPSLRGLPAHRQALGSLQVLGCRVSVRI